MLMVRLLMDRLKVTMHRTDKDLMVKTLKLLMARMVKHLMARMVKASMDKMTIVIMVSHCNR